MKINLLIITFAVMLLLSPVAKSAEAYPPVGPYRSVGSDVNQVRPERIAESNSHQDIDYWRSARQANMRQVETHGNRLRGSDMYRNEVSQQRNYPMRPVHPQVQMNPAHGNGPQVRGPIYAPNMPPADRYNYPNKAMQRPMSQYPPAWR